MSLDGQLAAGAVAGFTRFRLAMIQLRPSGEDKSRNLNHAKDMIMRAASGDGQGAQPDLIMLPASSLTEERMMRI
jgi:predicted amidohydrolase